MNDRGSVCASSSAEAPLSAFVRRNGTHFYADGSSLRFLGFNHPLLLRNAASNDSGAQQYLHQLLVRA